MCATEQTLRTLGRKLQLSAPPDLADSALPLHRAGSIQQEDSMNTPSKPTHADETPVWFITGCSSGFGLELARQAIEGGYRTVVTARDLSKLPGELASTQVLVLKLDVTEPDQVAAAVKAAQTRFGGIDVLVNNAGIGYFAAIEEGEVAEVRKMFEVNVFGLTSMVQAVLPGMRQRRRGCIVNLSSLAGLRGMPALGQYNATKFAVEGLSEALRREVEPLGIQVMVVNPSGFRTDWAGRSANESEHPIEDYQATAGAVRAAVRASSGKQPGDPVRGVQAIMAAVASGHPPHHLLLGNDAFEGAIVKLDELRQEFTAGEAVARGADFEGPRS
jgi:NAD(P)-dependent dehydrogenase (short-subunit alcohol dehydrogenase family)